MTDESGVDTKVLAEPADKFGYYIAMSRNPKICRNPCLIRFQISLPITRILRRITGSKWVAGCVPRKPGMKLLLALSALKPHPKNRVFKIMSYFILVKPL